MNSEQINIELLKKVIDTIPENFDILSVEFSVDKIVVKLLYDVSEIDRLKMIEFRKKFWQEWQDYVAECDKKLLEAQKGHK